MTNEIKKTINNGLYCTTVKIVNCCNVSDGELFVVKVFNDFNDIFAKEFKNVNDAVECYLNKIN